MIRATRQLGNITGRQSGLTKWDMRVKHMINVYDQDMDELASIKKVEDSLAKRTGSISRSRGGSVRSAKSYDSATSGGIGGASKQGICEGIAIYRINPFGNNEVHPSK